MKGESETDKSKVQKPVLQVQESVKEFFDK